MAAATLPMKFGCWICGAEMFTLALSVVRPASCQRRNCAATVRRMLPPMGTISPVSSASPIKSPGSTRPRVGWCQRTSASTESMCPRARSTIGW